MDLYFDCCLLFFFFKQKTAYEMRISDWSSDVCSSDLLAANMTRIAAPSRAKTAYSEGIQRRGRIAGSRKGETDMRRFLTIAAAMFAFAVPGTALAQDHDDRVGWSRDHNDPRGHDRRSEEHTSELQSLMPKSYAAF